jgi:Uncharacterized Rossmann fold enzyme
MFLLQTSYCRILRELLGRAGRILDLYELLVEPSMGYPRHRESIASLQGPQLCYEECLILEDLVSSVEGSNVCIIGPLGWLNDVSCTIIGAPEGGAGHLIALGVKPLYVTGDLDVDIKTLDLMLSTTRIALIHVHGDNIERLLAYKRRLQAANVVYTSQIPTTTCTLPLGGFTDGDRAVVAAMLAGAREIKIVGYDFEKPSYNHKSVRLQDESKSVKLRLAAKIIEESARTLGYTMTWRGGVLTLLRIES